MSKREELKEGDKFVISPVSIHKQLPPVLTPVLVITATGAKYVGVRFEATKSTYKWGLIYNGKIIGIISDVTHWSGIYKERSAPVSA